MVIISTIYCNKFSNIAEKSRFKSYNKILHFLYDSQIIKYILVSTHIKNFK